MSGETTSIQGDWDTVYSLYRDPPEHAYQAVTVQEHIRSGWLLIKVYGGRGATENGNRWIEYWIPADERDRLADAIRMKPEAQP